MAAAKERPEESAEAVVAPAVKTVKLDHRNYLCPTNVLLIHAAMRDLPSGSFVCVVVLDPSSWDDVAKFAKNRGHGLERTRRGSAHFFRICKK